MLLSATVVSAIAAIGTQNSLTCLIQNDNWVVNNVTSVSPMVDDYTCVISNSSVVCTDMDSKEKKDYDVISTTPLPPSPSGSGELPPAFAPTTSPGHFKHISLISTNTKYPCYCVSAYETVPECRSTKASPSAADNATCAALSAGDAAGTVIWSSASTNAFGLCKTSPSGHTNCNGTAISLPAPPRDVFLSDNYSAFVYECSAAASCALPDLRCMTVKNITHSITKTCITDPSFTKTAVFFANSTAAYSVNHHLNETTYPFESASMSIESVGATAATLCMLETGGIKIDCYNINTKAWLGSYTTTTDAYARAIGANNDIMCGLKNATAPPTFHAHKSESTFSRDLGLIIGIPAGVLVIGMAVFMVQGKGVYSQMSIM